MIPTNRKPTKLSSTCHTIMNFKLHMQNFYYNNHRTRRNLPARCKSLIHFKCRGNKQRMQQSGWDNHPPPPNLQPSHTVSSDVSNSHTDKYTGCSVTRKAREKATWEWHNQSLSLHSLIPTNLTITGLLRKQDSTAWFKLEINCQLLLELQPTAVVIWRHCSHSVTHTTTIYSVHCPCLDLLTLMEQH